MKSVKGFVIGEPQGLSAGNWPIGIHRSAVVGLCVGHDSLFIKFSEAPVTVLIAKDRVLAHNPVGALYCARATMRVRLSRGTLPHHPRTPLIDHPGP